MVVLDKSCYLVGFRDNLISAQAENQNTVEWGATLQILHCKYLHRYYDDRYDRISINKVGSKAQPFPIASTPTTCTVNTSLH